MSTQKNEHNPDRLTPEQYGAPEWRLLREDELQDSSDEYWCIGEQSWTENLPCDHGCPVTSDPITYRRRITPPTDTTGSGREGETVPMDHVIDRSAPLETQLAQAEAWIAQLQHSYRSIQQTCTNKDAQVEALRRDGERLQWILDLIAEHGTDGLQSFPWSILNDPANDPDEDDPDRLTPILDRAAIDSAQRQEGR